MHDNLIDEVAQIVIKNFLTVTKLNQSAKILSVEVKRAVEVGGSCSDKIFSRRVHDNLIDKIAQIVIKNSLAVAKLNQPLKIFIGVNVVFNAVQNPRQPEAHSF